MDEFTSQYVYAEFAGRLAGQKEVCTAYTLLNLLGLLLWKHVAEAAAAILMEGPEKHSGKDYWFFSGRT